MKKKLNFFCLLLIIIICSCKTTSPSSSIITNSPSSSSKEEVNINDLIDDSNALGQYSDQDNVNRYPDDPLYDLILQKKAVLQVDETYVEDFEKEFIYTRIYPTSHDQGVTYTYQQSGNCRIDRTSLCLQSPGNYQGIYFGGMKFAANSTYHISFDYKIIVASNDFFFQFRSISGGISSDLYTVISGKSGDQGTIDEIFYLKDYSDYQLMLFPRNEKGTLAIDNLTITRLNSRPQITDVSLLGKLKSNETITFEYEYFDAEGDPEGDTTFYWFTSLDQNGKNKTILSEKSNSLKIDETMKGKYIGISLIPHAQGNDEYCIGERFDFYSDTTVDDIIYEDQWIRLNELESFTEDFEQDFLEENNLYGWATEGTDAYITMDEQLVIDGKQSLFFHSSGDYRCLQFDGIHFAKGGKYQISFDYRFLQSGENFYVQFRSKSESYSHDKFVQLSDFSINEIHSFTASFSLDDYDDYYLMMFPSITGCTIIIDNISITRLSNS